MTPRLILFSIHDVAPAFEPQVDQLLELAAPFVGERLAMLVVPNHWASDPLRAGTHFATRLRNWSDLGVEIFLHGWRHRDESAHSSIADRFKAQGMTAGEGEFLGLDRNEARDRMERGRALIEGVIGRPVAGFIAPAWLYGAGAMAATRDCGFVLAEDHMRVWSPTTGRQLLRSPVITWASRTTARRRSSLLLAAAVRNLPMPATIRVAVHPGDCSVPKLVASIGSTLAALCRSRRPAAYAELMVASAPQAAMSKGTISPDR